MREVAAAIIIEQGRLLLARRRPGESLEGAWELPGGKVEPGETTEECLRRELHEELGIDSVIDEYVGSSRHAYGHGVFLLQAYFVTRLSQGLTLSVHDRVGWFYPFELADLEVAPADLPLLELLEVSSSNEFRSSAPTR